MTPNPLNTPVLVKMSDVEAVPVRWLWLGRLPLGRLALLAGMPGLGKSFATIDFAARVSTGTAWPDGSPCEQGSVLFIAAEDDPADTVRPRLDAHGADVTRVHMLKGVRRLGQNGQQFDGAFLLDDLTPLETVLTELGDIRRVVIDPIGSYLGGRVDAHRDNDVRAVLAPLAALASKYDVAILLVAHIRKGTAAHADDLVLGSRAFTGSPDRCYTSSRHGPLGSRSTPKPLGGSRIYRTKPMRNSSAKISSGLARSGGTRRSRKFSTGTRMPETVSSRSAPVRGKDR